MGARYSPFGSVARWRGYEEARRFRQAQPPVFAVEKNVPPPDGRFQANGKFAELRRTLQSMKAGDSFVCPCNKSAFRAAQQVNVKITTRKENGQGWRVWRVSPAIAAP